MKILFSESNPNYTNYNFPYAIWGIPDSNDQPYKIYDLGFLPTPGPPERFYLARSIRVNLSAFSFSSENRRIIHKFPTIELRVQKRSDFDFNEEIVELCSNYASKRLNPAVMPQSRIYQLFDARQTSHLLLFFLNGALVGIVTAFIQPPILVHYNFAFFVVDQKLKSLGMFMLTSAVAKFAHDGIEYLYAGTCYSTSALYKTQFRGVEFFNGVSWSKDMDELKFLIKSNETKGNNSVHLLESNDYLQNFHPSIDELIVSSKLSIPLS